MAIVGVLQNDVDPMVSVMKLEKAPTESYADIGGLDQQVQEIKVPLPPLSITSPLNLIYLSFLALEIRKQSNFP